MEEDHHVLSWSRVRKEERYTSSVSVILSGQALGTHQSLTVN